LSTTDGLCSTNVFPDLTTCVLLVVVSLQLFADTQQPGLQQECGDSFTSGSTDVVDGVAQLLQQARAAAGQQDEQRWVPYRHTNGVAIYHHKQSTASCSLWHCDQVQ
jgi:hypothetical protein